MKATAFFLVVIALLLGSCGASNVDYVKPLACERWKETGFECIGYEGYKWSPGIGSYGRGHVWHRLRRIPDSGLTYSGFVERWGDELHVYGPEPSDGQTLNHRRQSEPLPE